MHCMIGSFISVMTNSWIDCQKPVTQFCDKIRTMPFHAAVFKYCLITYYTIVGIYVHTHLQANRI